MQFLLIVVISLVVLGAVAALFSIGSTDEPIVQKEGDCASCTSKVQTVTLLFLTGQQQAVDMGGIPGHVYIEPNVQSGNTP